MAPFIFTYLVIWWLPKWILTRAFKESEYYITQRYLIEVEQQIARERQSIELKEQTLKRIDEDKKSEKQIQQLSGKKITKTLEC